MATFLQLNELNQAYIDAETDARHYFTHFDEYERLAANKVRLMAKHYPKVNDGTLSALLLEIAKRVFPDMFKGEFTSTDRTETWLIEIINILWNRKIVPGADTDADFYTKFWNMVYRCEQHGASSAFVFFSARDGYTGADFSLDYIKDIFREPGKISTDASNYVWRNSYHTKLDLMNIIEYAQHEESLARKQKRKSYSTWDTGALKEYVNRGPQGKGEQEKNLTEREKQLSQNYYKLATCFHRGTKAPFYTIIPALEGRVSRTRSNENPTGDIPIVQMYHTQDLINPYGKGLVEIAGQGQNVLDYMTQADVLATQKGLAPPVRVGGTAESNQGLVLSSIVHGPNAIWRTGGADVQVVETSNSVYASVQSRISLYKSNVMNQLGAFDSTVAGSDGNPQFSKTDAGVNNLESRANVNDNFFGKNIAAAAHRLAKTMMNVHMANMKGTEAFTFLEDEIERLQSAGWDLGGTTQGNLAWDKLRGKYDFSVDDPAQVNDPETEGLATVIKTLSDSPEAIQQIEADGDYKVDLGEGYRQYFSKLQLSKLDKIIVPIDTKNHNIGEEGEDPSAPASPAGAAGQTPASARESVAIDYKDAPADIQAQMEEDAGFTPSATHTAAIAAATTPQPSAAQLPDFAPAQPQQPTAPAQAPAQMPEDPAALRAEHAATIKQYKVTPELAAAVMAARRQGYPEQVIANQLAKGAQK